MKSLNQYYFIVASILVVCWFGCQSQSTPSTKKNFISFEVNSIRVYDANQIPKNQFIFSPIDKKDKIWTINTQNIHELDLTDGRWTALSTKFGKECIRQIRENQIWNDPFTNDVYISCFHNCLIRYSYHNDTYDKIDIKRITVFLPKKDRIVLGSVDGLYYLNRKNNSIEIAENFPCDIWVKTIEELNTDTLILNNRYLYDTQSNTLIEKEQEASIAQESEKHQYRPSKRNEYKPSEVQKILPSLGEKFKKIESDSITWYYSENNLCFTKDNKTLYRFLEYPTGKVRRVIQDDDYLYLLYNEQFVILNKKYIIRNSIIYKPLNYQKRKKELTKILKELSDRKISLTAYLKKAQALQKSKRYDSYADLKQRIDNLPNRLEYFSFDEKFPYEIHQKIKDGQVEGDFLFYSLVGLCRYFTVKADLPSALKYFEQIDSLFPTKKHNCIEYSYPCIKKIAQTLDSLSNTDISNDTYLYNETLSREELIKCSCWFGEDGSYFNNSIVTEKHKELLSKYPQSDFADDSEYWLLMQRYNDNMSGGFPLEYIPLIRKFAEKYPKSNLIPALFMNIAHSHTIAPSKGIDSLINKYDKAIEELENCNQKYALDSLQKAKIVKSIKLYKAKQMSFTFDLSIKPLKLAFQPKEDISIEVIIANKSSIPQTLELFDNSSLVSFSIHPEIDFDFRNAQISDTLRKEIVLTKGNPLKQTVILNKNVRYWKNGEIGKFVFPKDGLYYLTASSRKNKIRSKQIKLYIEK